MGEICLSVAPILRCQSLSRLEAGILLLPAGFEIIFAIVLLWVKRASSDKKHVFLASEIFVYFLLAVLDLLTHTIPTIGTSIDTFRSLDIIIGVASFIPLFLYTFALYLFTSTELVPILPVRFQNIAKYVLIAFIPLIILMNELGSFVGITYRTFGGSDGIPLQLGVGFTDGNTQMFLSSVTLVLLTAFQASNFCIAFYRLMKALSHQRTIDSTQAEKELEAHLFRGLGWIVAGLKLGAIETVIGFAQDGFGVAFTRRLLRLLSHACLIIGMVKGVDTVEDFQLFSPSQAQKRRKSALRAMIQNPRFSTFRHVGGHDFDKQNPFDEKRNSVIKLGDPSWMRRDFVKSQTVPIDGEGTVSVAAPKRPSVRRKAVRESISSKRSSWQEKKNPIEQDEFNDIQQDAREIEVPQAVAMRRPSLAPRLPQQRVTVHIRQDRLPVLELRRLSDLEFLDLVQDPFRDPHMRVRSLPGNYDPSRPQLASPMSLPALRGARGRAPAFPAPVAQVQSARESVASRHSRSASFTSYDRPWSQAQPHSNPRDSAISFGSRNSVASYDVGVVDVDGDNAGQQQQQQPEGPAQDSFLAIGSPSETISSWVSPGSTRAMRFPPSTSSRVSSRRVSRRSRGVSSETTASDVEALTMQFPGIPAPPFAPAMPMRRSMLSQEVPREEEFIAEGMVPESSPASSPAEEVERVPSFKRKAPSPLVTEGLVDQRLSDVVIEQVTDEEDVAASLPTPMSAPRPQGSHSQKLADVPLTPFEDEQEEFEGEQRVPSQYRPQPQVRRSKSLAKAVSDRAEADMGANLVRVKSVGNAPMRSVSAAHRTAMARESVMVELGHVVGERRARLNAVAGGGERFDERAYARV